MWSIVPESKSRAVQPREELCLRDGGRKRGLALIPWCWTWMGCASVYTANMCIKTKNNDIIPVFDSLNPSSALGQDCPRVGALARRRVKRVFQWWEKLLPTTTIGELVNRAPIRMVIKMLMTWAPGENSCELLGFLLVVWPCWYAHDGNPYGVWIPMKMDPSRKNWQFPR